MDTRTRHALKKDKFAQAAASSASWISVHRSGFVRWIIVAAVVLIAGRRLADLLEHALLGRRQPRWAPPWMFTCRLWPMPGAPPQAGVYTTVSGARQGSQSRVCGHRPRFQLVARGLQGTLFCGRHLRGTGPERRGRDESEGCRGRPGTAIWPTWPSWRSQGFTSRQPATTKRSISITNWPPSLRPRFQPA